MTALCARGVTNGFISTDKGVRHTIHHMFIAPARAPAYRHHSVRPARRRCANAADKQIRVICKNWSGFAPLFVASDLSYFKTLGLDVSVKLDDEQSDALASLIRGRIEVDMRRKPNQLRG